MGCMATRHMVHMGSRLGVQQLLLLFLGREHSLVADQADHMWGTQSGKHLVVGLGMWLRYTCTWNQQTREGEHWNKL